MVDPVSGRGGKMRPLVKPPVTIPRPAAAEAPSSWLLQTLDLLPDRGRMLDVACGGGRDGLFLASAGWTVCAVDRDPARIEALRESAERLSLPLEAGVLDLEAEEPDLGDGGYDLV